MTNDPGQFLGKPDEYLEAAKNNPFNPLFCPRHWMPCPVEGRPGLLVSIIMMTEAFAYMPEDVIRAGHTAMNSWQANQIKSLCCKLGDEKMAWLWRVSEYGPEKLCYVQTPEPLVNTRACWRLKGHDGEHEWERSYPRSVFDLMSEVQ